MLTYEWGAAEGSFGYHPILENSSETSITG